MDDVEPRVFALLDAGDADEAASVAIRGYGSAMFVYVSSRIPDADDAFDVFQQWSEDVWGGLRGFRRECRLRTWAYKLAQHAAARFLRDPYKARRERLPSTAASRIAASVAASSLIAVDARRRQLRDLEAQLPSDDRVLVYLRHDKELSWDEIAEILSAGGAPPVTAQTLRKRYERIKEKVRQLARAAGLLDEG